MTHFLRMDSDFLGRVILTGCSHSFISAYRCRPANHQSRPAGVPAFSYHTPTVAANATTAAWSPDASRDQVLDGMPIGQTMVQRLFPDTIKIGPTG